MRRAQITLRDVAICNGWALVAALPALPMVIPLTTRLAGGNPFVALLGIFAYEWLVLSLAARPLARHLAQPSRTAFLAGSLVALYHLAFVAAVIWNIQGNVEDAAPDLAGKFVLTLLFGVPLAASPVTAGAAAAALARGAAARDEAWGEVAEGKGFRWNTLAILLFLALVVPATLVLAPGYVGVLVLAIAGFGGLALWVQHRSAKVP